MKKQLNSDNIEGIELIFSHKYNFVATIMRDWYASNKRDLPWRESRNPYHIWISEIILQQTRVAQGYNYYLRFITRFPTIFDLANADEMEVLVLWQGLGYYSRARNLHNAAKTVVEKFGGEYPSNYNDILSLKGIGQYTAAAVASFAYGLPYAVVDGNVYRVLSRIFAIDIPIDSTEGKKLFASLAQQLMGTNEPGQHNQAIMEFGALQCVPVSPNCGQCPLSETCLAYAQAKVSAYPVKANKTKVSNRYFNYLDIRHRDTLYLQKRESKDIWQHLYELPLIETTKPIDLSELMHEIENRKMLNADEKGNIQHICNMKHVLSHQIIYASFYKITVDEAIDNGFIKIDTNSVQDYPVSRLVEKYFNSL